jgi:hypothetical protein
MFTSATIITSAILFQGFKGTGIQIATVIMGFMQICAGVVLLQLSKSAKDVPDAAVFKGDLDQIREVATQEEPEYEPKADSIRGAASILRRISTTRREHEHDEARRFYNEKQEDFLKPPGENEIIEWDGIRRRKTVIGEGPTMSRPRTPRSPSVKQQLPPLGMSRFPDPEPEEDHRPSTKQSGNSFLGEIGSRTSSVLRHGQWLPVHKEDEKTLGANIATEMTNRKSAVDTEYHGAGGLEPPFRPGRERSDTPRSISWADEKGDDTRPQSHHALEPPYVARRQFSFNSMFNRRKTQSNPPSPKRTASPPRGILRRNHAIDGDKSATEEERLGLVRGDSRAAEETLGDKLDRWSSAESDVAEIQPMHFHPMPPGRPHGDSVSSMSTSAFPPYEDHHAFYAQSGNVSNPYYLPHTRQATSSPEHMDEHEAPGRSAPRSRTRTNSSSHVRAPPPAQSSFSTHRHPNPLPPLPDNTPLTLENENGVRSVSGESSDMGVASISSTEARDDDNTPAAGVPTRQHSGWRRHMSETSSADDGESYEIRNTTRGGRGGGAKGAFL